MNLASAAWGTPVLLGTLFVCIALAIKGLDALVPGPPSLVIAAGLTYAVQEWVPGGTAGTAGWLGTAVTLGMLVHAVGDAVTESGAPLLWPVPIRGRTWYPVGGPRVAGSAPAERSSRGSWPPRSRSARWCSRSWSCPGSCRSFLAVATRCSGCSAAPEPSRRPGSPGPERASRCAG